MLFDDGSPSPSPTLPILVESPELRAGNGAVPAVAGSEDVRGPGVETDDARGAVGRDAFSRCRLLIGNLVLDCCQED